MKFATKAIHTGEEPKTTNGGTGDVVAAIHVSTTFARREVDKLPEGYEYSRTGNPTRHALESKLAAIEDAKFGLAFSSGVAAESTVLLSLLKKDDHVVAFDDLYGGTRRLFDRVFSEYGVQTSYVDATAPNNVEKAIRENTRLIWLETPTNPLMKICDIQAIAEIGKARDVVTVVDNTFASPYFQSPLKLGADISLHSTTKYIGGHSDVIGGAIMLSDEELFSKLKFSQNAVGAIPSPFDCFLTMRGIKTLAVRMQRHNQNAQQIAEYLEAHSKISKVLYPGLKSHPQYELAKKQMSGFGGMVTFEVRGDLNKTKNFLGATRIFALAESLGGVESLIEQPATMTHAGIAKEEREKIGIKDNLVRMSVGIEDAEDLIEDLEQALNKI